MLYRPRAIHAGLLALALVAVLQASSLSAAAPTPDAALLRRQWALEMVNAPCAWQRTTGSADVSVAVLDSGVDLTHPALVGRLRDDGYDFLDGDDEPLDTDGHGTHVAGIIAATLADAEGVSGLAPGVSILPVRVLDSEGGGDPDIAAGIRYAADNGAQVINLSLGASLLLAADETSPELDAAIEYAARSGSLVVVAAGNDYLPLPNVVGYQNPNVMVVAASNREDRRARFSNYGAWVSVVAPGDEILSTMPTYDVFLTSEVPSDERLQKGYDSMSGTSMAAPYAAALAALVFSALPDATPQEVKAIIEQSADQAIYATAPEVVRRLRQLGAGRIDACAALQATGAAPVAGAPTAPPATARRPTATTGRPAATPTRGLPSRSPIPTIVARRPVVPGVPTPTPGALPPASPVPAAPVPQTPVASATAFIEALRTGDLRRAQGLSAPARLGGEVQIDLVRFVDLKDYFDRMDDLAFAPAQSSATTAEVTLTYNLRSSGGGAAKPTTGTIQLVRDGPGWYVQSFDLPGAGR